MSVTTAKPARVAKRRKTARGKIDRRTKAFRAQRAAATDAPNPTRTVTGEAQAVLAVLAVLAPYPSDVRKAILRTSGQLA